MEVEYLKRRLSWASVAGNPIELNHIEAGQLAQALQEAARYRWLQDWYFREGKREEIDPHGHVRQTTPLGMDMAIDAYLKDA